MNNQIPENNSLTPYQGIFIGDEISVLDMTVRSYNALRRAGIRTIEDLLHYPVFDLPKIKNLTPKCVQEVTDMIHRLQISTLLDVNGMIHRLQISTLLEEKKIGLMIPNTYNVKLSKKEERWSNILYQTLLSVLPENSFEISLMQTEGELPEKYLQLSLPLCPEGGDRINTIEIVFKDNYLTFEYFESAPYCISNERGCIAANAINESTNELPIVCTYQQYGKRFSIVSKFQNPEAIVSAINSLLCVLDYISILSKYMRGDDSRNGSDMAFEAITASCGYINKTQFEDYNLYDANKIVKVRDWIDELQDKLYDCDLLPETVHNYITDYRTELSKGVYPEIRLKDNALPSDDCFLTLKCVQEVLLEKARKYPNNPYVLTSLDISRLLAIPFSAVVEVQSLLADFCNVSIERIKNMYAKDIDWFMLSSNTVISFNNYLTTKFGNNELSQRLLLKGVLLGFDEAKSRIEAALEILGTKHGISLLSNQVHRDDGWFFYGLYTDPVGCIRYMKEDRNLSSETILHIIRCEPMILYAYKEVKSKLYAHDSEYIDRVIFKYVNQLKLSEQIEQMALDINNGATDTVIKLNVSVEELCSGLNGEPVMLEAYAHLLHAAELLSNSNHHDLAEMVNIIN